MNQQLYSKLDIQQVIGLVKSTRELIENREMAGHVKEKGRADYVTQVDIAVQDYLKKELYSLAPDIQFLGEETGMQEMTGDLCWILDPVDGTTNLIHDYRHSAVSLGLCCQGEIAMGIIYNPWHEELFSAEKGKGSFLNGQPIHVSESKTLSETIIALGTYAYRRELADANFARLRRVYDPQDRFRRAGIGIHGLRAAGRLLRALSEPVGLCGRASSCSGGRRQGQRFRRQSAEYRKGRKHRCN